MNREIKFKAWDEDHFKALEDDGDYYFRDDGDGLRLHDKWGECKNTILLQFTNLNDKNGKEIYEGDVVEVTNKGIQNGDKVVVFDPTTLSFVLVWAKLYHTDYNTGQGHHTWLKISSRLSCVIKGNIYENPELIQP